MKQDETKKWLEELDFALSHISMLTTDPKAQPFIDAAKVALDKLGQKNVVKTWLWDGVVHESNINISDYPKTLKEDLSTKVDNLIKRVTAIEITKENAALDRQMDELTKEIGNSK